MIARLLRALPLCLLVWIPAQAEETADAESPPAGHSTHGEAFNEGPRQRAYLMDGTGAVTFPATTKNEQAQKFINQGLGQLHGFWYFEAERSFRQAAALDPDCAIAYWGMAMANVNNEKRAKQFIAEAVKRKAGASERETMYIDALDAFYKADPKKDKDKERRQQYVRALEKMLYKFPDDIEAKAFLGLCLWQNRGKGLSLGSHLAVDALLRDVLAVNPMHPCHHYIIHLWDSERPENAVTSAALCGQSAPTIAHMWHMPGHTYSKLKRYRDAAWQQEASARVDHAHMIRDRVMPDQIHNFAHNNEWLIRDLIFIGRMHDARDLAKNMLELPRHPSYNSLSRGSSHYGRMRLFEVLSQFEQWDDLIALSDTMYLGPTDKEDEQVKRLRHLGRAYFAKGDVPHGKAQLAALEERAARQKTAEEAAVVKAAAKAREEARKKFPAANGSAEGPVAAPHPERLARQIDRKFGKEIEKARADARKSFDSKRRSLQGAIDELKGYAALAAGDVKQGLDLLKKADGMDRLLLARRQAEAGRLDEAEKTAADYAKGHKNEVLPLATLIDIRWRAGKKKEARQAFEELRAISNDIDLDAPAMVRLAPVAKELGYDDDWRVRTPFAADTGKRPDLNTLGPFRWHPSPAPAWTLKDVRGEEHSLAQYHGKPVVVIFYLGYGCLHCAQQLQKFAPKAHDFAEAGIELIAISTDDQPSLQQSLDNYKDGTFPFPLVSNADLDVFKAYRCYDDFEAMPLHGTFLIDAAGLVRWQDISYQPFMDPDFVLNEAQRLLGTSPVTTVQTAKPAAE